mgnify:CR=1 FL=1
MSTAYILMAFLSVWISIEILFYTSTRLAISETSQTDYKRFIWPVRSLALILLIFAFLVVNLSNQLDFVDLIFICTF